MDYTIHTAAMVSYRKKHGITQSDVAHAMLISQPAVARLEQRLSNGADVTLSVLERYAAAVGLAIEWTLNPLKPRYGIFRNAQDAVAFAVHSSACEGLETPQSDIENLKRVARGEISGQELKIRLLAGPVCVSRHNGVKKQVRHQGSRIALNAGAPNLGNKGSHAKPYRF